MLSYVCTYFQLYYRFLFYVEFVLTLSREGGQLVGSWWAAFPAKFMRVQSNHCTYFLKEK